MAGIGIITNPYAKLNKRNPERKELLAYIAGSAGELKMTSSLGELSEVAKEFCDREIDILAINGGDGTISQTLTAFIKAYQGRPLPYIALLRGGTMNMLADNLNVKGTPEQILYRLVEAYATKNYKGKIRLPSLKIEDNYGFLFAQGSAVKFLDIYYRNKSNGVGVVALIIRLLFSALIRGKSFDQLMQYEKTSLIPDKSIEISHLSSFIFCGSVQRLPMKIKFFKDMHQGKQSFECVSILANKNTIPLALPFFLQPKESLKVPYKIDFCCKHLEIKGLTPDSLSYTLDGEIYRPQQANLEISIGPELEFVIV